MDIYHVYFRVLAAKFWASGTLLGIMSTVGTTFLGALLFQHVYHSLLRVRVTELGSRRRVCTEARTHNAAWVLAPVPTDVDQAGRCMLRTELRPSSPTFSKGRVFVAGRVAAPGKQK